MTTRLESAVEDVKSEGGICTTVSNFPSFDAFLLDEFPDLNLVDRVKYQDLEFSINGRKVFESLARLQNISYYALTKL